jgi:hypothetical protein
MAEIPCSSIRGRPLVEVWIVAARRNRARWRFCSTVRPVPALWKMPTTKTRSRFFRQNLIPNQLCNQLGFRKLQRLLRLHRNQKRPTARARGETVGRITVPPVRRYLRLPRRDTGMSPSCRSAIGQFLFGKMPCSKAIRSEVSLRYSIVRIPKAFTEVVSPVVWQRGKFADAT